VFLSGISPLSVPVTARWRQNQYALDGEESV
jgi:hypothetical protein